MAEVDSNEAEIKTITVYRGISINGARVGPITEQAKVLYRTKDGTAVKSVDYVEAKGENENEGDKDENDKVKDENENKNEVVSDEVKVNTQETSKETQNNEEKDNITETEPSNKPDETDKIESNEEEKIEDLPSNISDIVGS